MIDSDFPPDEVITEVVAVIGGEDNDGLVPQAVLFQSVEDQAELSVDKAYAGVVGLHVFFAQGVVFFGELEAESLVPFGESGLWQEIPHVWSIGFVGDFFEGIKIEVLVGSEKGNMRLL